MTDPTVTESGYQTTETPRNSFYLLWEGQAEVSLYYNRQMLWFRYFMQGEAVSVNDNTPPGSPVDGNVYLLGTSPTGVWAGLAGHVALYHTNHFGVSSTTDSDWISIPPKDGMLFWVEDLGAFYRYDSGTSAWVAGPT